MGGGGGGRVTWRWRHRLNAAAHARRRISPRGAARLGNMAAVNSDTNGDTGSHRKMFVWRREINIFLVKCDCTGCRRQCWSTRQATIPSQPEATHFCVAECWYSPSVVYSTEIQIFIKALSCRKRSLKADHADHLNTKKKQKKQQLMGYSRNRTLQEKLKFNENIL